MNMQILFKSGASLTLPVGRFVTMNDPGDGTLARLTWTTPTGWRRKLCYVNVNEVAAVVAHRDVPDTSPVDS